MLSLMIHQEGLPYTVCFQSCVNHSNLILNQFSFACVFHVSNRLNLAIILLSHPLMTSG